MKMKKVLGSFAWVLLAAALIFVNAAAANADEGFTYSKPSATSSAVE